MIVTAFTRETPASRRFERDMLKAGFVEVKENGHPLWKLHRGGWYLKQIIATAAHGKRLYIKVQ